ncbi:MAG: 3-deoxy-8-phosphooctulonate synthase [Candidatus Babeliales bacterium]|jgi:2-dehydro-3-deoxyphosphooctonate aldolase (KDO 8-P synthase)
MKNNSALQWVEHVTGNNEPLFFILGPCVMENEADTMRSAEFLKTLSEKLNFKLIFKGSFDKANRTALQGFRGIGIDEGLKILTRVKDTFNVPVITDVHETVHVNAVADVVDVLQIPAFLCRQTDLLFAAGTTKKPVHVKKGQFETPESMHHVIGKIESTGNTNVWLCERGFSFGYNNLVVDYRNFPIMKNLNKPVVFDVTHSVQRPGGLGCASGGDSAFITSLAAAAIVQGIAGLFLMVHPEPSKARCCGPVSVTFQRLEPVLTYLIELDAWAKSRVIPEIQ